MMAMNHSNKNGIISALSFDFIEMKQTRISLEQWRSLVSVVEAGGYAQAAEAMNKSISTVSYAIGRIEQLLSIKVFEVHGRKAQLTEAGSMLFRRGRALLEEADRLERAAEKIAAGWEVELRLAAEIIFPTWLLLDTLAGLGEERPELRVQLHESVLGGTEELLTTGQVDLAIASSIPGGFVGDPLVDVHFVAAAAPSHPLHQLRRTLTLDDLRQHRHLLVRDTATQSKPGNNRRISEHRWTVSSKATSIRAACMGLGFAWYAEDSIRRELQTGALKPLPLGQGGERRASLYLVYADIDAAGPATRRLAELLHQAVAEQSRQAENNQQAD